MRQDENAGQDGHPTPTLPYAMCLLGDPYVYSSYIEMLTHVHDCFHLDREVKAIIHTYRFIYLFI